jgi:hypothetical protein
MNTQSIEKKNRAVANTVPVELSPQMKKNDSDRVAFVIPAPPVPGKTRWSVVPW